MKLRTLLFAGLLLTLVLSACGGGGGAPVAMTTYEGSALTIEYPEAWKDSSMDMFGMTIGIFSPIEMGQEALQGLEDPFAMLGEDPLVMFLALPPDMATEFDLDEFDEEFIPEEEGVTIVRQGDVKIDDLDGKEVVAKGAVEELDNKEIGAHLAAAKKDDGSAVLFIGLTPKKDLDKNLDIFEHMLKSVDFK